MKRTCAQYGLRFLGITDDVVQPVETEVAMIERQALLTGFTFLLKDGNYLRVEFQSTNTGEKELRRFQKYEALLSDQTGKDVYTYVIYGNDIKHPQTSLKTGFNDYNVKAVVLAGWDSKQVLDEIKEALEKESVLEGEQLTALAFVPVMSHSTERVEVISEAVKISHKLTDSQKKMDIQAILFAFANKFLDGMELAQIQEEIEMSQLGQMIYEDGMMAGKKAGIKEGKIEVAKALLDIMSDEAIAKRTHLPLELVVKLRIEGSNRPGGAIEG